MTTLNKVTDKTSESVRGIAAHRKSETLPLVSVIVPTYKEAQNLPILIPKICDALESQGMSAEILIVDDNSPDDTVYTCQVLSDLFPVTLLVRTEERGLSSAVLHGMKHAAGDVLLVMDADLSHPPEKVPELVKAIVEKQGDFVIGSRYVPGGTTDDSWSLLRWVNSKVATEMSRGLTSARDPMAGFFALPRQAFLDAQQLNPIGYKIGLELIVKCHCKNVCEVPIHFRDRLHGESKLSFSEQIKYVRHLGRLYRYKMGEWFAPLSFAAVGASGMIVDLILLTIFMLSLSFPAARALSIFVAMSWNYLGNRFLTFADRHHHAPIRQYLMYCGCSLFAASVSWGISSYLWEFHASQLRYPAVAAIAGIGAGVILNYLSSHFLVFPRKRLETTASQDLQSETKQHCHENDVVKKKVETDFESALINKTEHCETSKKLPLYAGSAAALLIAICVTFPSWFRSDIDGLDQAHNVLTSVFFYDFYRDMPLSDPIGYVYNYHNQYPALGFMFWPPLFHAVCGAVMQITGPGILAVRLVLAGFSILFALSMYWAVTRTSSWKVALGAVLLASTTPVLFQLENTSMLEVPSLAMCFVALWMYQKLIVRSTWNSTLEAILAAVVCAAIVYTKQPAMFILPAIVLDLFISHRHLLLEKRTWLAGVLTVILLAPLVLFTIKYGHVNIAQSIGNQGNIYVEHHQIAPRWSLQGWTYYPNLLAENVPAILLLFSAIGASMLLKNSKLLAKHGVWFWAIVCWYLMFSYFDNKQIRFVSYVVPFLSIIACIAWEQLSRRNTWLASTCMILVAIVAVQNVRNISASQPRGYNQMAAMLIPVITSAETGNLACFGEDHHLFTAQLRLLDKNRERYNLKGNDILASSNGNILQALKDYQVRWLIVQPDLPSGKLVLSKIASHPDLFVQQTEEILFDNGRKSFPVILYKYQGELAASMKAFDPHQNIAANE